MFIKVTKATYKRKIYHYVKVIDYEPCISQRKSKEKVIATLGTIDHVKPEIENLISGLERIRDQSFVSEQATAGDRLRTDKKHKLTLKTRK